MNTFEELYYNNMKYIAFIRKLFKKSLKYYV